MANQDQKKLDPIEKLKEDSRFLRGTIKEGLEDPLTAAISDDDTKLLKFHGSYQQDDRDVRDERRKQKLEPAYQFMLRVAIPGGVSLHQNNGWQSMILPKDMGGIIRLN